MRGIAAGLLVGGLALMAGPAAADWVVMRPPAGTGTGCALESSPESLTDGYQATTARIRVDAKRVSVASPSVLDPGFTDIGLAVDQQGFVPMDRVADPRTAVFESRYSDLVEQFKAGARVRVQLRFWPTWPATGTHSATITLVGFTRAYAQLAECQ